MSWKWMYYVLDTQTMVEMGPYPPEEISRFRYPGSPFIIIRRWVYYDCHLRNQNTIVVTIY